MFKNYLSYQFALSFQSRVQTLSIPNPLGQELARCSQQVVHHFTESLAQKDRNKRAQSLFVALTYLRDCRDLLDQAYEDFGPKTETEPGSARRTEIDHYWDVLHSRLERLCLESADAETGQLRMLG